LASYWFISYYHLLEKRTLKIFIATFQLPSVVINSINESGCDLRLLPSARFTSLTVKTNLIFLLAAALALNGIKLIDVFYPNFCYLLFQSLEECRSIKSYDFG